MGHPNLKAKGASDALTENKRALGFALALTAATMLIEAAGSFLSGSLALLADALGSFGVLAAGVLIKITESYAWDPTVSAGVCVLILWSSARLVRDSFHVLMEGAPADLDVAAIQKTLAEVPGVADVHDLHVWTITSGFISLSAHLKISKGQDIQGVIRQAHLAVSSKFNVPHATFQPEIAEEAGCETASCLDGRLEPHLKPGGN
jgi:Co/Zn/Cd efflux system component